MINPESHYSSLSNQRDRQEKCIEYELNNGQKINICTGLYDNNVSHFKIIDSSNLEKYGRFYYNNVPPPKYGFREHVRRNRIYSKPFYDKNL